MLQTNPNLVLSILSQSNDRNEKEDIQLHPNGANKNSQNTNQISKLSSNITSDTINGKPLNNNIFIPDITPIQHN